MDARGTEYYTEVGLCSKLYMHWVQGERKAVYRTSYW